MSRKINWSDAPFNWPAEPALDEKVLNSPQPCSHGSGCRYDGPCAFVHKGEEGTGRRLFPARTVDGKEQPACVRLIGSPGFYERRRLRLSWPDWCAKKGIQTGAAVAVSKPVSAAPVSGAWPQLGQRSWAQPLPLLAQPLPLPQQQQMSSQAQPFFPAGYMDGNFLLQQAIAQHGSIEKAIEFQRYQMLIFQQQAAAAELAKAKKVRDEYGQKLYDKLLPYVADIEPMMAEKWPKGATAGKLAGIFLELDREEWDELLTNEATFEERVGEALDVLREAAASR